MRRTPGRAPGSRSTWPPPASSSSSPTRTWRRAGSALGGYAEVPIGAERFDAVRRDRPRHGGDGAWRTPYRAYLVASQGTASAGGGAGARSALLDAGVEPRPRVPRRRVVPRVPQDPLAGRTQALARQLAALGPRVQAALRPVRRAGAGRDARLPLRVAARERAARGRRGSRRRHRGPVRHRAVRPLVVRGRGLPRLGLPQPRRPAAACARSRRPSTCASTRRARRSSWPRAPGARAATTACGSTSRRTGPGGGSGRSRTDSGTWRPGCSAPKGRGPVLAQAARELLLAQASDWQFIITTGAVTDYAERRFTLHAEDAERLVGFLESAAGGVASRGGGTDGRGAACARRDLPGRAAAGRERGRDRAARRGGSDARSGRWSCTGTSTSRRARTRGSSTWRRRPPPRRSTTGTSASRRSATAPWSPRASPTGPAGSRASSTSWSG